MPINTAFRAAVVFVLLLLANCSKTSPIVEKRYAVHGEVVSLDPQAKVAAIKAGKIGDWMEPMTMEYPIRPESDYAKLKVGDHIEGTVVVRGDAYYVTGIRIVAGTGR